MKKIDYKIIVAAAALMGLSTLRVRRDSRWLCLIDRKSSFGSGDGWARASQVADAFNIPRDMRQPFTKPKTRMHYLDIDIRMFKNLPIPRAANGTLRR